MTTPVYAISKADVFMRPYGSTAGFTHIGDCESAQLTLEQNTEIITSNGNDGGTLAELPIDSKVGLNIVSRSIDAKNLANAFYSTVEQVASGSKTVAIDLAAGEVIVLDGFNVVLTTTLVEGTDYELDAKLGVLKALVAIDESITYTSTTYSKMGILALQDLYFEVQLVSRATGTKFHVYKFRPTPTKSYDVITSSISTVPFEGSALIDTTRVYSDPQFGKTARITVAG